MMTTEGAVMCMYFRRTLVTMLHDKIGTAMEPITSWSTMIIENW